MFIRLTPKPDSDTAEYRVDFDRGIVLRGRPGVTHIERLVTLDCVESPEEIAALIVGRGSDEVTDDMLRVAMATEYDMRGGEHVTPYPARMRAAICAALRARRVS
jgi:hypothetical protein